MSVGYEIGDRFTIDYDFEFEIVEVNIRSLDYNNYPVQSYSLKVIRSAHSSDIGQIIRNSSEGLSWVKIEKPKCIVLSKNRFELLEI